MKRKTTLKVSGMHCATCKITVEKALKSLDGVENVSVNLNNETASVEYDGDRVKPSEIIGAIEDGGYGVINEKVAIKIGGMHCATCVNSVEEALKTLGVETTVNLNTERAYVTYNPDNVTIDDMKRIIEDSGYQFLGIEGRGGDEEKKIREKDLRDKLIRIVVGLSFSLPLMALMLLNVHLSGYLTLSIVTIPFIYVSHPIFRAAYHSLKAKTLSMDVMYSFAMGVAFISSLFGTLEVLPENFMFYDTALMLAAFLMVGRYLETRARRRTLMAIKKLIALQPKNVTVIRHGREEEIPIEEIAKGEILLVRVGEHVPTDGGVEEGEGWIDESMISGEPIPVLKGVDSRVVGGTIVKDGFLKIKATRIGEETLLAQIIKLVQDAQGTKPRIQMLADRVVNYFLPAVLGIAIVTLIV